jgi:hypothetical protein
VASETTTANPELLQMHVANLLVQPLEATSVVLASGVRIFDTSGPAAHPQAELGAHRSGRRRERADPRG